MPQRSRRADNQTPDKKSAELLLRPSQTAKALNISPRKLWELTNSQQIPCVRIGRCVRYSLRTLEKWIIEREENKKETDRRRPQ